MSELQIEELEVGQVVGERTLRLTRDSLVRYAGASGDFNTIHYRDDIAERVGLPGVLAHGMLTMGSAVQIVIDWAGGSHRIKSYQVRFTRPVIVDPEAGAEVAVTAKIGAIDAAAGLVKVDLTAVYDGKTVLGKAFAQIAV